jgi:hypothetical protein
MADGLQIIAIHLAELLILTLWLSAELFEIMLRQVKLESILLHTINVWGSNSTIWEIVYFI